MIRLGLVCSGCSHLYRALTGTVREPFESRYQATASDDCEDFIRAVVKSGR
jgi:hypothetical protein